MAKLCNYCGKNPVPHFLFYLTQSLNILFAPVRQLFFYNRFALFLKKYIFVGKISVLTVRLLIYLKIIRQQTLAANCSFRRAQVLWEEAEKRGIKMKELLFFGKSIDVYEAEFTNPSSLIFNPLPNQSTSDVLRIKDKRLKIIFSGLPRPAGYINPWLDLMDDKWLFKKLMMEKNLPVAEGGSCWSFGQAKEVFNKIQSKISNIPSYAKAPAFVRRWRTSADKSEDKQFPISKPVIVKPRSGSRGRHSTTFVSSTADLKKAFKIAKQLCFWVMVEEQLTGPVYRATVINFELCGVLRGDPPQIVGDGQRSVAELISEKNQKAHPGVKDIVIDEEMERFVKRELGNKIQEPKSKNQINSKFQILNSYIPLKDEAVHLTEKIGANYGGSSAEELDICHPDNKELFVKAAKILNDPILGFDFIIPDIAKSWKEQKCGFIEVNSLPFINLHHDPLLGRPQNVAAKVWEMIGM